jgi:hypothetical protein
LGKFHIVFSAQIIPTKVCLENSKVTKKNSEKIKVNEFFIHVSAAYSQSNCFKNNKVMFEFLERCDKVN